MKNEKNVTLHNNVLLPVVGFGTFQLAEGEECASAVRIAIKNGYRHIDTASVYQNETSVGEAIRQSEIDRKELFITSKVYNESRTYDLVLKSFDNSLKRLQMDYLDLFLIHWPANEVQYGENARKINAEVWRALETIYKEGRVRAIGLSNFMAHRIQVLFDTAEIKPMVNQIEYHPGFTQAETTKFCLSHNIQVEAWSTLARGRVFENPLLKELSLKYQKSVAQLVTRWAIQNGVVPLVRSKTSERIIENIQVFDFSITSEDMLKINQMNLPRIGTDPDLKTN